MSVHFTKFHFQTSIEFSLNNTDPKNRTDLKRYLSENSSTGVNELSGNSILMEINNVNKFAHSYIGMFVTFGPKCNICHDRSIYFL